MNPETRETQALGGASGSAYYRRLAKEDPRNFWAPWIVLCVVCVALLVIAHEGTSAVAVALVAHLFRAMAADDMPDKSPNAPAQPRREGGVE